MKVYTIIGGVNGSGKSSLTGVLRNHLKNMGVIVDVDRITAKRGKGSLEGGKAAIRIIDEAFEKGVDLTQETTLAGMRAHRTAAEAKERGYHVRLYYVGLDTLDECLKRIKNRVAKGGHDIPCEDVERRFSGRFEALQRVLPYCDEATFFDNDNGFVQVAEYRNGEIIPIVERKPQWLTELMDFYV